MSRIGEFFAAQSDGKRALVCFITAGDPTLEHTVPAMHALVAGGADILELGVPFSDPEAEGPTIQASSERALANGVRLLDVLDQVAEFRRQDNKTPVVLMGYLNSILAMNNFAQRAADVGVDGLILVNLPPEEGRQLKDTLDAAGIDLIYLLAPTTTAERSELILQQSAGFVYYVSLKGTTGSSNISVDDVTQRVTELRAASPLPVCIGFGIKDADTAAALGEHADGVVVGSALVAEMAAQPNDVAAVTARLQAAAADLRKGLDRLH